MKEISVIEAAGSVALRCPRLLNFDFVADDLALLAVSILGIANVLHLDSERIGLVG
jgi:hypothetical protein